MEETTSQHQLKWAEFKAEIIKTPTVELKRFDDGTGNRFYYSGVPGNITTAAGITTVLSGVMPESKFLTDWKLKHGTNWVKVLNAAATYGTLMHTIFGEWLMHKKVPQELLDSARAVCISNKKSSNMPEKDLLSFIRFCEDHNVKPLVLEGLLRSQPVEGEYYAMAVDFLCSMTIQVKTKKTVEDGVYVRGEKKGQPKYKDVTTVVEKKIIAIIDFKSNFFEKESKSFFESHMYQLIAAKRAVRFNFDLDVDVIYNFAPNAWRKEPTYSLKEWSPTNLEIEIFDTYMRLARLKGLFTPRGSIFIPPTFNEHTKSSDYKIVSYTDITEEEII